MLQVESRTERKERVQRAKKETGTDKSGYPEIPSWRSRLFGSILGILLLGALTRVSLFILLLDFGWKGGARRYYTTYEDANIRAQTRCFECLWFDSHFLLHFVPGRPVLFLVLIVSKQVSRLKNSKAAWFPSCFLFSRWVCSSWEDFSSSFCEGMQSHRSSLSEAEPRQGALQCFMHVSVISFCINTWHHQETQTRGIDFLCGSQVWACNHFYTLLEFVLPSRGKAANRTMEENSESN